MNKQLYKLFCQSCAYTRTTDGSNIDDLYEIKTSKIQGKIPYWDEKQKKTVIPEYKKQTKKFRCPGCGKGILIPKKIDDPQRKIEEIKELEQKEILSDLEKELYKKEQHNREIERQKRREEKLKEQGWRE
jgi:hypothetical protein